MKVKELIEMLSAMNPEADVMYQDDYYATDINNIDYIEFEFDPNDGKDHNNDWNRWESVNEVSQTILIS